MIMKEMIISSIFCGKKCFRRILCNKKRVDCEIELVPLQIVCVKLPLDIPITALNI